MMRPKVSILMVARNARRFIDGALSSARDQTFRDLEVVVVDDGSTDDTAAIVKSHGAADPRVRLVDGPRRGLSAVRNASLSAARGRLGVVLDSDDVLHPRHVEDLVTAWERYGDPICAGNMVEFEEIGAHYRAQIFAQGPAWLGARRISLAEYVEAGMIGGSGVPLGYLKPLLDLDFLRSAEIGYDERLRIGEDLDFVIRAMMAGAHFRFLPQATYYYRRHAGSTSHRLSRDDLNGLLAATRDYTSGADPAFAELLKRRRRNLEGQLLQIAAIEAIKARQPLSALKSMAVQRDAFRQTVAALWEAVTKRVGRMVPVHASHRTTPIPEGGIMACLHSLALVDGETRVTP